MQNDEDIKPIIEAPKVSGKNPYFLVDMDDKSMDSYRQSVTTILRTLTYYIKAAWPLFYRITNTIIYSTIRIIRSTVIFALEQIGIKK